MKNEFNPPGSQNPTQTQSNSQSKQSQPTKTKKSVRFEESRPTLSADLDESLHDGETVTVKQESDELSEDATRTFVVGPYGKAPGSSKSSDAKKSKRGKKHIKFEYIQQAVPAHELLVPKQELHSLPQDGSSAGPRSPYMHTPVIEHIATQGLHTLSPTREAEVISRLELQNRKLLRWTPDMNSFVARLLK